MKHLLKLIRSCYLPVLSLFMLFAPWTVLAQKNLSGTFTAETTCAANIRLNGHNPGKLFTETGVQYKLLATNGKKRSHYLIEVEAAPVSTRRWVGVGCGSVQLLRGDLAATRSTAPQKIAPDSIENVLSASWQPAFCQTSRGKSKRECKSQTPSRPDATQFSIHGLWPDDLDDTAIFPCYCDSGAPRSCKSKLDRVDRLDLDPKVRERLDTLMPGTQSGLHLHEWSKHGSCYEDYLSSAGKGSDADEYFLDTMQVLEQLNASAVRELFVKKLGQTVSFSEVQAAFDTAFGPGSGQRVVMRCSGVDGVNVLTELWIGLAGEIGPESQLSDLILNAPTTDNSTYATSCRRGLVVEVLP